MGVNYNFSFGAEYAELEPKASTLLILFALALYYVPFIHRFIHNAMFVFAFALP